ncbi:hypothetical protein NA57DRAFT_51325 [Rhizodiscina lignyota]|uniref:Uncharacterized protein n=1 Tax=Rhizodiscina lignyota TaxID=1504668 RepID=A0A9P4ISC5_9PEZI|nr:hypothetical protein NA57DRAFT_51325 [Rhizodiscina lignyota]
MPTSGPPPPIRTVTSSSTAPNYLPTPKSTVISPTTPRSATSTKTPNTPAERSFFGALAQNIRERSRSRSRARQEVHKSQASPSSSPTSTPISTITPTTPTTMSPRTDRYSRPHSMRVPSEASTASNWSSSSASKRASTHSSEVSFEKFSYGRHSNDWLFNGFSVKDTASKIFHRSREE